MFKDKMVINVNELAEVLGISKPRAYDLVHTEGFPVVKVSERRLVVPVKALEAWLEKQAEIGIGY